MDIEGVILTRLDLRTDPRGWLAEVWRADETEHRPAMGYVSVTRPGVVRGPHEHREQTDYFVFLAGRWRVSLWDNRGLEMFTYREPWGVTITEPTSLLVPPGVIHAYQNVGFDDGLVLNLPDRLYAGWNRAEPVDEIRHEDSDSPFKL